MEAMRQRLFAAVAGFGLLSAMVGCFHTAGKCDCEYEGYGCACCGYGEHYATAPGNGHVISSVPISGGVAPPMAVPIGKPVETIPAPAPKTPPGDDGTTKDKE
jgi:hypothetical protein